MVIYMCENRLAHGRSAVDASDLSKFVATIYHNNNTRLHTHLIRCVCVCVFALGGYQWRRLHTLFFLSSISTHRGILVVSAYDPRVSVRMV